MTLILAAMNSVFSVQVTDRRLTSGAKLVDDEYEKCFSLVLPGFRLSLAFAGLAKIGAHSTKNWLIDKLYELGEFHQSPIPLLDGIALELTKHFTNTFPISRLKTEEKALIISVIGYNSTGPSPLGLAAEISNTGNPTGQFVTTYLSLKKDAPVDWTWVGAFGSGAAAAVRFEDRIRNRLQAGAPACGLRRMMERMIREAADHPMTAETVGKQLDSITLYSDLQRPIEGGGSTMVNQFHARMPSSIFINADRSRFAFRDIKIEIVGDTPRPVVVPNVHRHAPCPCGAGKRYKNCHGRKSLQRSPQILPGSPGSNDPSAKK